MALFSRRPKNARDERAADQDESVAPDTTEAPHEPDEPETPADSDAEAAASVDISVSSFRGLGAQGAASAPPAPAAPALPPARATAPPATETVPGLRDNVLVRETLASLSEAPSAQQLMEVARQLLQGHLFLRVKGDARQLLSEGKGLPLAVVNVGERRFALAYSSGAALQASVRADGDAETSAMGQPVLVVIRHVLAGPYEGLIIDPASAPARAVVPRALLEKLIENIDERLTLKTLLAQERTAATAADVADAVTRVPLWVAVARTEGDRLGVAEARGADGSRFLEIFSHPLEVAAMGRNDQAAPLTATQLAAALRADAGLSGVIVDPRGPWIRLSREDLAPLLAPA